MCEPAVIGQQGFFPYKLSELMMINKIVWAKNAYNSVYLEYLYSCHLFTQSNLTMGIEQRGDSVGKLGWSVSW